jgi:RimJ/RimL family protein N-acetyltransferase
LIGESGSADVKPKVYVETDRLILRNWGDHDSGPFARMNADPRVMEFFPKPLSREESDALIARERARIDERGYGLYAAEESASGSFMGFVGLAEVGFAAAFAPATEVGWRLSREFWGSGYATEAAKAVAADAFTRLGLESLVSFTAVWNTRSQRVMEKIGMIRDAEGDFIHPGLPAGHKLAPHVLYRIDRKRWLALK